MCRCMFNLDSWELIQPGPHRIHLLVTCYHAKVSQPTKQADPLGKMLSVISVCETADFSDHQCVWWIFSTVSSADSCRVQGMTCGGHQGGKRTRQHEVLNTAVLTETTEIHRNCQPGFSLNQRCTFSQVQLCNFNHSYFFYNTYVLCNRWHLLFYNLIRVAFIYIYKKSDPLN